MPVETLEIVDWTLDGGALLLSLAVAKYVLELSVRELAILVGCTVFYVTHEMWESEMIGGSSHRAFELWIHEALTVAYNDVDLCLKALAAGKRNLLLPRVRMLHHESLSRGDDRAGKKAARLQQEADHLTARWGDLLQHDFYYNPNLTHQHEDFTLATPLPSILQENRPWGRVQRTSTGGTT